MSRCISFLAFVFLWNFLTTDHSHAAPSNDDFENREVLSSTAGALTGTNLLAGANLEATKQLGEPDIEGNSGGKSVWFTWTAPENVVVTLGTQGSDFDTLLGVFTGSSLTGLSLVASGDDTLGPEPLTSLVSFHAPSGTVYQIVFDGYRGDSGEIASGNYHLSLAYVPERYTVSVSVNDTNRGAVQVSPAPDADGRYQVTTVATFTALPQPGWFFDSWSGDLAGSENPVVVSLHSNMNVVAKFLPVPVGVLQRSPATITRFMVQGEGSLLSQDFKVWHSSTGTLDYIIEKDVPWLEVYPSSGSTRGETNTHSVRITQPTSYLGNFAGTIRITPLAEGGVPQSVVVALRVDPPTMRPQWQRIFDSPGAGYVTCIRQTADGGFIASGQPGVLNFDVMRFDARGTNLWTYRSQGSALACVEQTADGGFILGGTGSVFGQQDFYVERLDAAGSRLWGRAFGGTNSDQLTAILKASDGGFFLAGTSFSGPSGNKTSTAFGAGDYWLVRLDQNGKRLWDQSFGGTNLDQLRFCEIDSSGAVLLGGDSASSASGNKTNLSPGFWTVRVDVDGNKVSETVHQLPHGVTFAQSVANGGMVAISRPCGPGGCQNWVGQTDAEGNAVWEMFVTDSPFRAPFGLVQQTDGSIDTYWNMNDGAYYRYDTIRMSSGGEILWRRQFLFGFDLGFTTLLPTQDGALLFGGIGFKFAKLLPPPPRSDQPFYSPLGFRMFADRGANGLHVTEYSTNLADWIALRTNFLNGTELEIFDPTAANDAIRFYRTRPLP